MNILKFRGSSWHLDSLLFVIIPCLNGPVSEQLNELSWISIELIKINFNKIN